VTRAAWGGPGRIGPGVGLVRPEECPDRGVYLTAHTAAADATGEARDRRRRRERTDDRQDGGGGESGPRGVRLARATVMQDTEWADSARVQ
jgi:hypothetical protein